MSTFSQNNSTKFYWPSGDVADVKDLNNAIADHARFQIKSSPNGLCAPSIWLDGVHTVMCAQEQYPSYKSLDDKPKRKSKYPEFDALLNITTKRYAIALKNLAKR